MIVLATFVKKKKRKRKRKKRKKKKRKKRKKKEKKGKKTESNPRLLATNRVASTYHWATRPSAFTNWAVPGRPSDWERSLAAMPGRDSSKLAAAREGRWRGLGTRLGYTTICSGKLAISWSMGTKLKNTVGPNSVVITTIDYLGSISHIDPKRTSLEMPSFVRNRDLMLASSGRSERYWEGFRLFSRVFCPWCLFLSHHSLTKNSALSLTHPLWPPIQSLEGFSNLLYRFLNLKGHVFFLPQKIFFSQTILQNLTTQPDSGTPKSGSLPGENFFLGLENLAIKYWKKIWSSDLIV